MKRIFQIAALSLFSLYATTSIQAQTRYKDYFVVNTFKMDDNNRFQVFRDKASFDAIFHPAATMAKQSWVQPTDFDKNILVAVMKGNTAVQGKKGKWTKYDMTLKRIKVHGDGKVVVEYTCKANPAPVTYDGGNYLLYKVNTNNSMIKKVVFKENGKEINTVKL